MADPRRVLIVDGSPTVCSLVDTILREYGFVEIKAVQHGQAALDRMQASAFDLVICDCELAPVSGIDVLQHARRQAGGRRTGFILMSDQKDMQWILAARQAGADCIMAKPFTPAMLMQKISQMGARS